MPLERADIEGALSSKGFSKDPSGDHNYFRYYSQGKKTQIYTKTSHGSKYKNLSDDLVSAMAKQCKLTTKQFKELVSCTMSGAEYEGMLATAGHIPQLSKPPDSTL